MGTLRSLSSRVIGVHSLRPATLGLIQEHAEACRLDRDPLPEVVTALRTEEEAKRSRWRGAPSPGRLVELLLTPDLLIVVQHGNRGPSTPDVSFHRLDHVEPAADRSGLTLTASVGPAGPPFVPLDDGPEAGRFREALATATAELNRPTEGDGPIPGPRHRAADEADTRGDVLSSS